MIHSYYSVNIYKYGDQYKVVYVNRKINDKLEYYYPLDKDSNNPKIGNRYLSSVSRTRSAVLGIGLCNHWELWCTFTLDPKKYNRYDLKTFIKDFSQYIRDMRKSTGWNISYLIVPELHKDRAWHLHGLMSGIPWDSLKKFEFGKHPIYLVEGGYRYHEGILNKFGYNDIAKARSSSGSVRYCLKYIGKGFDESILNSHAHMFYASQGLKRPELVAQGEHFQILCSVDYSNDYLSSAWISEEEMLKIKEQLY